MSSTADAQPDSGKESAPGTEARLRSVERGVRLFAVTILLLSSAPNLALALSIRAYPEELSGAILFSTDSAITHFIFNYPGYIVALALLWPLAGSLMTWRVHDPFRAVVATCIYLLLVLIQFTLTWIAFVAPMQMFVRALRRL